jgi:hypothetical protein
MLPFVPFPLTSLPWHPEPLPDRELRAMQRELAESVDRCPGHVPAQSLDARPFAGCTADPPDTPCNPRAHYGMTYTQICHCGAERHVNFHGFTEYGAWQCPILLGDRGRQWT